jgi:DNA-binding response OmpR family regulator
MSMSDSQAANGMHLALLINDEEWTSRSLESMLRPEGYAVVRAYTGRQGYELASRLNADLVVVDLKLPDIDGVELCRRLRELPAVRATLPIVMVTSGPMGRAQRLEAYRAGIWDVIEPPFDPLELVARLQPYVRAKCEMDQAMERADIDAETGCYSVRGLIRRLTEVRADARRSSRPLACVVIGPSSTEAPEGVRSPSWEVASNELTRRLGIQLLELTRESDAVARTAETDFVILAPGTDREGAERLIARVLEGLEEDGGVGGFLRAGVCAVSANDVDSPAADEFLRRATHALRDAQTRSSFEGWAGLRTFGAN